MRVIQVIGRSNTGKTTFIRQVLRAVPPDMKVATIKHLGHHSFRLDEGKDTTQFYQDGAAASAGIDQEKTVLAVRSMDLGGTLGMLSDHAFDLAIIEGFKTISLPSVVIGELVSDAALLVNPTPEDLVAEIARFPVWNSTGGMWRELKKQVPEDCFFCTLEFPLTEQVAYPGSRLEQEIQEGLLSLPGLTAFSLVVMRALPPLTGAKLLLVAASRELTVLVPVSGIIAQALAGPKKI